jgi:hypothetical protein
MVFCWALAQEFNELLQFPSGSLQIWIVGSREEVLHTINEFYVRRLATDRSQFSPMIPAPLALGKCMTLLMW